jgi:hypothetical protein
MLKVGQIVRLKRSAEEATLERDRQYFVIRTNVDNEACLDVSGKTGKWYPFSILEDWYFPEIEEPMIKFKVGDLVVPTFNYWSLKFAKFYVVDAITKVTYSKSRDYGQSRLSILDDRGFRRNYNPKNFRLAVDSMIRIQDRKPIVGDYIAWSDGEDRRPYKVYKVYGNLFCVEDNLGNRYTCPYDWTDKQLDIKYVFDGTTDMATNTNNNSVKTKSRYVIVNVTNGQVVASSGEKDPHFNEWTDETIKEWLNEEVSSRLRESPGAKFDVYSFEMQGKLPSISVDWSSK